MGHWFPETIIDNDFYDSLDIGSAADWIESRIGIKERRSVLSRDHIIALRQGRTNHRELRQTGEIPTIASIAPAPWHMALDRLQKLSSTGSNNNESITDTSQSTGSADRTHPPVELLIGGTSVPDWDIPANACATAAALGLGVPAYDVNSACSSFVVNLHVARGLLEAGIHDSIGIVNVERYTTRMDFTDKASCVLFGDGACASILTTKPAAKGLQLLDTIVHSDPAGYRLVQIPTEGMFSQNGRAVQKFAVTKTVDASIEILGRNGLGTEDVSYFIAHQANLRMLNAACQRHGIGAERHLYNVDYKGNQGAAGAPNVLSANWDRFQTGDTIVVAVVGSGLTWGAALFRAL